MEVQEVVEIIKAHVYIQEIEGKGEEANEIIVKEYYPLVMYWLDENNLEATRPNIAGNHEEISEFVNSTNLASLKKQLEAEGEELPEATPKKKGKGMIVLAVIGIGVLVYLASKK